MDRSESKNNNFGFLRLLLATFVIISHSPQILEGNRSHEILIRLFGTLSLGDVAVDGFFVISGYLITKSFLQTQSLTLYLEKRILRIFPGFFISFWICVLLIAPLVSAPGTVLSARVLIRQLPNSLMLTPPQVDGVFPGLTPALNGSMWTIAYEFVCYIAAMCAGMMGLYSQKLRGFTLIAVLILLLGNALDLTYHIHYLFETSYLFLLFTVRFGAIFGVGALYYLYRDKVQFTFRGALVSALILILLLFSKRWAEMSVAIFGGYLIFFTAFKCPMFRMSRFNNKVDLSYGIYLYGWPIAALIAWNFRSINPWLLSATTFVCAVPVAYFSWVFIEKPSLGLLKYV